MMVPLQFSSSFDSGEDVETPVNEFAVDEEPSSEANIIETVSIISQDGAHIVSSVDLEAETPPTIMSSRAYQKEMLNQSLKRNIIVAMDTGSGKTQVAVLRIQAELEMGTGEKIIWFLAPTVPLCAQQFEVIQSQNAAVPMKLVTGNDKVNTWSAQTWNIILENTRLIVSTPQVLYDALSHAFVLIGNLALLVFDEAHNCVGKNSGSKIMSDFYIRNKQADKPIPSILGLTASPIMKSRVESIESLEETLDAVVLTPTLHREELLKCVNKPELSYSMYKTIEFASFTPSMKSLLRVWNSVDISTDPYIRKLLADGSERSRRALTEAVIKSKTFTQDQIKGLVERSKTILRELGSWAADRYLTKAIGEFLERSESEDTVHNKWPDEERAYLVAILRQVNIPPSQPPQGTSDISPKVDLLVRKLLSVEENVVGIVFVKERVIVSVISDLLLSFPAVVEKYRVGRVVGTSNYHARKRNIYELSDSVDLDALQSFKSGRINLLVATSVLEEGIDVPACNLVVCFDPPANLKAFIQRRGRARMRKSHLHLLLDKNGKHPLNWNELEQQMKQQYEEDERELSELEALERSEDTSLTSFVVEATGARLDFDNAKSHLDHFCRVLSTGEFVDFRPDYIIHREPHETEVILRATVLLPSFLRSDLRRADSASAWKSEKNATKDAAFQAYVALYKAGLVNDNLLPFKLNEIPGVEDKLPEVEAVSPYDPWAQVAQAWQTSSNKWVHSVSCVDENGCIVGHYGLVLPVQLCQPRPIKIYLDSITTWKLDISAGTTVNEAKTLPDHTSTLISLWLNHRRPVKDCKHVVQLFAKDENLSRDQIGTTPFDTNIHSNARDEYLIRDPSGCPYIFSDLLPSKPSMDSIKRPFHEYEKAPEDVAYLSLMKWTRRADFLHRLFDDAAQPGTSSKPYVSVCPESWATVDTIPKRHAQFGMLIPSMIHELEVLLIAAELNGTLLQPIGIANVGLVLEAISSGSAAEPVNYERLEFLGDSILKFCACIQTTADHLGWPEGYLSLFKDRLVSNSRLHRAAIVTGLPKFILSKAFTGNKWSPLYLDDFLDPKPMPERKLGAKMLADVVEALIGASYRDGGLSKALKCISLFLNEVEWHDEGMARNILFEVTPSVCALPPPLQPLEELIGYSFQKKALLVEAMTHASCITDLEQRSLERLEFLGDSVLDMIIVTRLFEATPSIPHGTMHMLKTAMVNGDFLAFINLEQRLRRREPVVDEDGEVAEEQTALPLWSFMRHNSPSIGLEEKAMESRFQSLRDELIAAFEHGTHYPWALLARLQAKKFYADQFEALIGAIWVDSGSLEVCAKVLEHFGILPYLDRILKDNVHIQHPKEELGKLAVAETVNYAYEVIEGGGEREYRCTIHVGQRLVAAVRGGVNKEEVKTKAAEEAVKFLTGELQEMKLN